MADEPKKPQKHYLLLKEQIKLQDWINAQPAFVYTDTIAELAAKAAADLQFDITESNMRGAIRNADRSIPRRAPEPEPQPEPPTNDLLQLQIRIVADALVKSLTEGNKTVPSELADIARPQKSLFKEQHA